MRTPEGYERQYIERYLRSTGAWFCHPVTMGYGNNGAPDLICCSQGRFVAIEVKREGKGPTPLQQLRIEEIKKAGGFATWGTAEKVIPELASWLASDGR